MVANASRRLIEQNPSGKFICTACPAVVRYVQWYKPEAVGALLPLVSPMVAHSRYLKARYGPETAVVFVGPCIAKKDEALREECRPGVDAVLTLDELADWVSSRGLSFIRVEESAFDDLRPADGRLFPVSGGFARSAGFSTDRLDRLVLTVTGPDGVKEAVDYVARATEPVIVEALMCPGGCLGGVGASWSSGRLALRRAFLKAVGRAAVADAESKPESAAGGAAAASVADATDLAARYVPALKATQIPDDRHVPAVHAALGRAQDRCRDPEQPQRFGDTRA
jgi:iron only hydrogenase large subunit-like protein